VSTKAARRRAFAPVRAFLVDDSELILRLVPLCLALDRVRIVGMARSAEEAFPEIAAVRPDLIIADVRLPGLDGVAMAMDIREEDPEIKIILISIDKLGQPLPPQQHCADAFIAKSNLVDELAPTIRLLFPRAFGARV
jgi:DNA-binding NarL/FixJ family response regulator